MSDIAAKCRTLGPPQHQRGAGDEDESDPDIPPRHARVDPGPVGERPQDLDSPIGVSRRARDEQVAHQVAQCDDDCRDRPDRGAVGVTAGPRRKLPFRNFQPDELEQTAPHSRDDVELVIEQAASASDQQAGEDVVPPHRVRLVVENRTGCKRESIPVRAGGAQPAIATIFHP